MRAVIQRVDRAEVRVDEQIRGSIGLGLLALVSAERDDTLKDAQWLANKIVNLRVFEDDAGKMNLSIKDVDGSLLLVSQFTLHGDGRKGNRPSFVQAMPPSEAQSFFAQFVELVRGTGLPVEEGEFGAMMHVELINNGPVTILLDSRKTF